MFFDCLFVWLINVVFIYIISFASFLSNSDEASPSPYYFGTTDLFCLVSKKGKRSAPSRSTLDLTHRFIYYKGFYFEFFGKNLLNVIIWLRIFLRKINSVTLAGMDFKRMIFFMNFGICIIASNISLSTCKKFWISLRISIITLLFLKMFLTF